MDEKEIAIISAAVYAYLNPDKLSEEPAVSAVATVFYRYKKVAGRKKWHWSYFPNTASENPMRQPGVRFHYNRPSSPSW